MHLIKLIAFCLPLVFFSSFYDIHFTTIEGNERVMQNYQTKKILVIVLPATTAPDDSSFLRRIDSISVIYQNQLNVIGVPSYEDGFLAINKESLRIFYRSLLNNNITISDGLYSHRSSGDSQHDLFKWLTHKEQNSHFDIDVSAAGQKFFINEQGQLYGVFGPEARLSDKLMQRMIP